MQAKFFFVLALLGSVTLALAQGTAAPPTALDSFWAGIVPGVVIAVTALIGTLATILSAKLNAWFNITNEVQMRANEVIIRNVLHESVWSAVKFALQKTGLSVAQLGEINGISIGKKNTPAKEFIDVAIDYVRTKNPDTAAAAGLAPGAVGDSGLAEIALSKIPDLIKMLTDAMVPAAPVTKMTPATRP